MTYKHPFDKGKTLGHKILKRYKLEELATVLAGLRNAMAEELRKGEQSQQVTDALIQLNAN